MNAFFDRFLIDFYIQLRSPELLKSLFFPRKNKVFPKNRSSKLASIFARFWCQHASIFLPKIHPNTSKNRSQDASIFGSIFASIFSRFLLDFGANMPPFFFQKSTKILPKIDSKMHHFFNRFLHRFFFDWASILEANLDLCWPFFRLKYGNPI